MNPFKQQEAGVRWQQMTNAAVEAVGNLGWKMRRQPGRGMSNTWLMEKDGETFTASIRTTQDRWVAFPPLAGGTRWKTLDDVQKVIVAAVNDVDNPDVIEVYLFDQEEVRARFDEAYSTRKSAGHVIKDNYGFWINMDHDRKRDAAYQAGSGLAVDHGPIGRMHIEVFATTPAAKRPVEVQEDDGAANDDAAALNTVGDVMTWARSTIARLASVPIEAVKLDLKIQY